MYDFALFTEQYLNKIMNSRSVNSVTPLYALCRDALSATSQSQLTLYSDKVFVDKGHAAPFKQSYFNLYIESLIISKIRDNSYLLQFVHCPRIKDYSRAIEISIELEQNGVLQSRFRTIRGSDDDIWYFLIQLAEFNVIAKFKHQSGIPV